MAETRTAEQAKAEYLAAMGDELGAVYDTLRNELAWPFTKWHQYRELFGAKPERIDLLNQAAPLFFRVVQDTLWEGLRWATIGDR